MPREKNQTTTRKPYIHQTSLTNEKKKSEAGLIRAGLSLSRSSKKQNSKGTRKARHNHYQNHRRTLPNVLCSMQTHAPSQTLPIMRQKRTQRRRGLRVGLQQVRFWEGTWIRSRSISLIRDRDMYVCVCMFGLGLMGWTNTFWTGVGIMNGDVIDVTTDGIIVGCHGKLIMIITWWCGVVRWIDEFGDWWGRSTVSFPFIGE